MKTARAVLDEMTAEDDLLAAVTEALSLFGWLVHHDRRSDLARQQGHRGFPDVCAVHQSTGRLLFLELKSEKGRLTEDQLRWQLALGGSEDRNRTVRVLRPADLDEFLGMLR